MNKTKLGAGDKNRTRVLSLGSGMSVIFVRKEQADQNEFSTVWIQTSTLGQAMGKIQVELNPRRSVTR
jgi:hypothetical protein